MTERARFPKAADPGQCGRGASGCGSPLPARPPGGARSLPVSPDGSGHRPVTATRSGDRGECQARALNLRGRGIADGVSVGPPRAASRLVRWTASAGGPRMTCVFAPAPADLPVRAGRAPALGPGHAPRPGPRAFRPEGRAAPPARRRPHLRRGPRRHGRRRPHPLPHRTTAAPARSPRQLAPRVGDRHKLGVRNRVGIAARTWRNNQTESDGPRSLRLIFKGPERVRCPGGTHWC